MKFLTMIVVAALYFAHPAAPRLLRSEKITNETFAEAIGITAACDDICRPDRDFCCNCTTKKCNQYTDPKRDAYYTSDGWKNVCWERKEYKDLNKVCWTKKNWYIHCGSCYATMAPDGFTCLPGPPGSDCTSPHYHDGCGKCHTLSDKKFGSSIKIYSGACWEKGGSSSCNHYGDPNWMLKNGFWYEKKPDWSFCHEFCYAAKMECSSGIYCPL